MFYQSDFDQFLKGHSVEDARALLHGWLAKIESTSGQETEEGPGDKCPSRLNSIDTSTQSARVLRPSNEFVYTGPLPKKGATDDLSSLQEELPPTSSGYFLVDIGAEAKRAPRNPLTRGTVQLQSISRNKQGIPVVHDFAKPQQLGRSRKSFDVPSFSEGKVDYTHTDLEKLFELTLSELVRNNGRHYEYLSATAHYPAMRENLGLPRTGLQPGARLLKAIKHLPGIQSEYLYLSPGKSVAAAHEEDLRLPSANVLYCGAPKLWAVVNPSSRDDFLSRVTRQHNLRPGCDQFLRHLCILPGPALLRRWRIEFEIVLQPPGCLMLLKTNAIHWVLNLEANLSGAINYAKPDWDVPPLYVECQNSCTGSEPIRVADFKIGRLRSLDIDTAWEDPRGSDTNSLPAVSSELVSPCKSSRSGRQRRESAMAKVSWFPLMVIV